MRIVLLSFILTVSSCQHFKAPSTSESIFNVEWVIDVSDKKRSFKPQVLQRSAPFITPNLVIQANTSNGIQAYKRHNGRLSWFLPVSGGVESNIVSHKGRIFFGGSDGFFYALEIKTGLVVWKYYSNAENIGTPFIYKNTIYFMTSQNKIYALNIRTGQMVWSHSSLALNSQSLSIRGVSRPFVEKNRLYISSSNGWIAALNRKTGNWIWQTSLSKATDKFKDADTNPLVYGNYIYISNYEGHLFCIHKKTGRILWKKPDGSFNNPVIQGNKIYYTTSSKKLKALDRFSGRLLWSQKLNSIATQPLIYKSYLIHGLNKGNIQVRNIKNGKLLHSIDLFRSVSATPVLDDFESEIYVLSNKPWLYKLKLHL